MAETVSMDIIARVRSDFTSKFGIPRQSGLAETLAQVVFEPPYRNPESIRGIEGYSHLWIIWQFSASARDGWSPTVRPPKLGGNKRVGVFSTRSPFRPNPIGLSSVRLERVEPHTSEGPVLHIVGADIMDGTPVLDIKPYIPYSDMHPDAVSGFALREGKLRVNCPGCLLDRLPEEKHVPLIDVLRQDPRPGYHHDEERVYGFPYAGFEIRFTVKGDLLSVVDITPCQGDVRP